MIKQFTQQSPQEAFLEVRELHYSAGSREPFHAHEQAQLIYPVSGVAKIRSEQNVWVVAPGHALWLPGRLPHGLDAIGKVLTHNLYMTPADAQRASLLHDLLRLQDIALCHITLPHDRRIRQLCDALCSALSLRETLAWWGKQVGASERTPRPTVPGRNPAQLYRVVPADASGRGGLPSGSRHHDQQPLQHPRLCQQQRVYRYVQEKAGGFPQRYIGRYL